MPVLGEGLKQLISARRILYGMPKLSRELPFRIRFANPNSGLCQIQQETVAMLPDLARQMPYLVVPCDSVQDSRQLVS